MFDGPLHFEPYLRPLVWGGRRLASVLGKALPDGQRYGEVWEITDHASHVSRIDRGRWAGTTLRELMQRHRQELLGDCAGRFTTFPLLVKIIDAEDWLSVQVHPDDESVKALWPGEGGKTEAWFVLDASPESRIYAGLRPGVDAVKLRVALAAGQVAECLHSFQPRAGDCLFLRAGTVHAVGGGVLMAEVQQTSDATFRLFDWNRVDAEGRSRTLHIEQAFACIDWKQGPLEPLRVAEFREGGRSSQRPLVRCPFFELDFLRVREPWSCGDDGRLSILTAIQGKGSLGGEPFVAGQTWLIPASAPKVQLRGEPDVALLLSRLPA